MDKKYLLGLLLFFLAHATPQEDELKQQQEIFGLFKSIANNADNLNKLGEHFNTAFDMPDTEVKALVPEKFLEKKDKRLHLCPTAKAIFKTVVVFDWVEKKYVFCKNGLGYLDTGH